MALTAQHLWSAAKLCSKAQVLLIFYVCVVGSGRYRLVSKELLL